MKTIKFAIILVLGVLALTTTSQAATLTPQQAKNKAKAFMTQKKGSAAVRAMDRASWRPPSESVNAGKWSDSRLGEWLTLAGKSWYQELNNVYEQQGNKFVLKQHVTVPPFRSYLRTSSSILAAPSATSTIHPYYEYQQEYILNLPTDPDPGTNTGIDEITVNSDNADPSWYTIDGRQLPNEPVAPGLYIHKGKKVIKR